LNEGRPCHTIPTGYVSKRSIAQTDKGHDQIEKAFNKYFYRSDPPSFPKEESKIENVTATSITALNERELPDIATTTTTATTSEINDSETKHLQSHPQHEFEIIVCHANVIRYFLCRALQIPPEAWLRLCTFNCSLNYLVIRSTGSVSCRMIGDIGHLGYDHSTFSMHHGFNW
jgi:serine/threonine-protein phosphatase PGAM5